MQYENIAKKKRQTGFIIFLFILMVYGISVFVLKMLNLNEMVLVIAAVIAAFTTVITYWNSDKIVIATLGAREPTGIEEHYINEMLVNLCIAAGVSTPPRLYILETPQQNAFATGRNQEKAVICLTTGIIEKLNKPELEAVIAHELTHITNGDMALGTIISVMAGFITVLSDIALRYMRFGGGKSSDSDSDSGNSKVTVIIFLLGITFLILSPIITKLVELLVSRQREYMADAGAVGLTRNPEALIDALVKIHEDSNKIENPTNSVQTLFIANPNIKKKKISGGSSVFSSHPTLEERVKAIRELK